MDPIYLDHAATMPLRPEVREAMAPFAEGTVGNPSALHRWGRAARAALEDARLRVADLLGVAHDEVAFTRGGTESLHLAILGRAAADAASGRSGCYLGCNLGHASAQAAIDTLRREGRTVASLAFDRTGSLGPSLHGALDEQAPVALLSVPWIDPEIGLRLPVEALAEACREREIPLHVDAIQAAGHLPIDLTRTPIQLLSLAGHKLGGPVSTGVLVARRAQRPAPLLRGGPQEGGLRAGTEDVAGAVGFARALELAGAEQEESSARLTRLRDRLERGLLAAVPGLRVHGAEALRGPHILSAGIPGLPRDLLIGALDLEGIAASAGSACRSGSPEASPVLLSLYGEAAREVAPLRLSLGWTTTEAEIDAALERIPAVVERMRGAGVGG